MASSQNASKPILNFAQRETFVSNSHTLESKPFYDHYRATMCLNPVMSGTCHIQPINNAIASLETVAIFNKTSIPATDFNQCVLPKGHSGKCAKKLPVFNNSEVAKKLITSIDNCIYSTPGNDEYVYKNRASRLFPIQISNADEKLIRNKQGKKLKCAIPLKDASTPFLLATAYLDYVTYVLNIHDVASVIDNVKWKPLAEYIDAHKSFLAKHFATYNRSVFKPTGETICTVTKKLVSMIDFADVNRDARIDIRDEDIQMGHIESRSETHSSIRGGNLVFMSRRGNLIIGERNFLDNDWKEELRSICSDETDIRYSIANELQLITPAPPTSFSEVQNAILKMSEFEQSALIKWLLDMQEQNVSKEESSKEDKLKSENKNE